MGKHYARDRRRWPTRSPTRSSSTGGRRGRAPRCRRPTRPRSSRSPIAWTRSSAASPSASSRAARPIRSACAAPRSASGRSCSTRGWTRRCSTHAVRRDARRARRAGRRRSKDARSQLDEFFRARLRGIFVDQGIPAAGRRRRARAGLHAIPVDARARALALREDLARRRARCSSASRTSSTTRARKKLAIGATPRSGAVRRRRRRARASTTRSGEAQQRETGRAREPRLRRGVRVARASCARRSPRSSTRAASWSWIPTRRFATTGSRCSTGSSRRTCAIADFRLLGRCIVKYVRQFGGGTAEGRAQGQGTARRQGREPRRDGVARPAGAARLHDHDRGLPPRDGARRRASIPHELARRGRRGARARRGARRSTKFGDATNAAARLACARARRRRCRA